jgi:hypothetical protein
MTSISRTRSSIRRSSQRPSTRPCGHHRRRPVGGIAIGALTIVALTAAASLLGSALRGRRRVADRDDERRFIRWMAGTVAAFSFVAVAWSGMAAFMMSAPCAAHTAIDGALDHRGGAAARGVEHG